MLVTKTKKVLEEVIKTIEEYHQCDKCLSKIVVAHDDAFECTLEAKEGYRYPDCYNATIKSIELCQECTEDLLSLLIDHGYKIRETERSW